VSTKILKELDRQSLILAVWSTEFTRALDGTASAVGSPVVLRNLAERAAESADRAIEAIRILLDVEFRLASYDELERCYMPWEKFVDACRNVAVMDGYAELATNEHYVSNIRVYPVVAVDPGYVRPSWATHVLWYNK
jgi:hypothetical protein